MPFSTIVCRSAAMMREISDESLQSFVGHGLSTTRDHPFGIRRSIQRAEIMPLLIVGPSGGDNILPELIDLGLAP